MHRSEAQGDKRQWAALHYDPKAAGLSLGKATQERSVGCALKVNTP